MSINVTLGEVKTQEIKPFPKLMIVDNNPFEGRIVLFTREKTGMLVRCSECQSEYMKLGTYLEDGWAMQAFTDYNEPITLQNA